MDELVYDVVIPTLQFFRSEGRLRCLGNARRTLPYIVFSFVEESLFTPAVKKEVDPDLLGRIFDFPEQMALSRGSEVVNLLWVGLFEAWASEPRIFIKAVQRIGPATKKLAFEAFQGITGCDLASMS